MALTGVKTFPMLAGTLATTGPWASLFARAGYRIYPYHLGAKVRTTSNTTTIQTYGLGDFLVNDYIMIATQTNYGNSVMFVPDTSKIRRVSVISTSDDQITIDSAVSVTQGDYIVNLGADGAATPEVAPNFDGTRITLYDDNVGQSVTSTKYFQTGTAGQFIGWITAGRFTVDLLVTNSSGNPAVAIPFFFVGPPWEANQVKIAEVNSVTPSVAAVRVLKTANTSSTTFTNLTGGIAGQIVTIIFNDANTGISSNSNFKLSGNIAPGAGVVDDTLSLVFDGTIWREIGRSVN